MGMLAAQTGLHGRTAPELAADLGIDRKSGARAVLDPRHIADIATQIDLRPTFSSFDRATWDDPRYWNSEADREQRSQYFAIGNSINFRFWILRQNTAIPCVGTIEGEQLRGAMYMWRCLRRAWDNGTLPLLDASFLAELTREQFDRIFSDDDEVNPLAVGSADRIANLKDLGHQLLVSYDGQFLNVVKSSAGSLSRFAEASKAFRAFDDPLLKLTMVNAILHSGSGVYDFLDDPLPAMDYHLVRHALRQGMVRPSPMLAKKLRSGYLLHADEALELRRVTLSAFLSLTERTGVKGEVLDNKFWLNRANCTSTDPVCTDPSLAARCPFYGGCAEYVNYGLPLEITRYY
jgi:putative queuosine salvage protein